MAEKFDEVALRCPNCGSLAAGRVLHQDRMAGKGVVRCIACKRTVAVPVPQPALKAFLGEMGKTFRLYAAALKAMGWWQVLVLLAVWGVGFYLLNYRLGLPSWLAFLLPAVPFLYIFARTFTPLMRAQVRGELGVLRIPSSMRGISERDPIPVRKPGEAVKIANARPCPRCGGKLSTGEQRLTLPVKTSERLRYRITRRASRMYEQVEVTCQDCGDHGYLYFDISALDVVRRLGYTPELVEAYPQKRSRSR